MSAPSFTVVHSASAEAVDGHKHIGRFSVSPAPKQKPDYYYQPPLPEFVLTGHHDKSKKSNPNRKRGKVKMAKMLGGILSPKKTSGRKQHGDRSSANASVSNSSMAVMNDNATLYSIEGHQSVAAGTVYSQVTVKISNKNESKSERDDAASDTKSDDSSTKKHSKGWRIFKQKVLGASGAKTPPGTPNRTRAASASALLGSEINADSAGSLISERSAAGSARAEAQLDLAIKGRLDGVDVLALCPVRRSSVLATDKTTQKDDTTKDGQEITRANFDPFESSFTGLPTTSTPADLVSNMILVSAGKEQTELIFEGYIPGGDDRWRVCLEDVSPPSSDSSSTGPSGSLSPPSLQATDDDEDESTAVLTEDGSTNMASHKLWDHIWGDDPPPPIPTHMQACDQKEDDILQLAAACSVPIDLDEDSFIIDSPEHLRSVHDLAMIPIQGRRFESALSILTKLLNGLKESTNEMMEHLVGCTYHNIGIILLCQKKFSEACENFDKAIEVRTERLSQNHPDVAVSLMRKGDALFAQQSFEEALKAYNLALGMSPAEDATRAKIFNNIGVVQYYMDDLNPALKSLTSALEIQRQWLDGSIRRESIVYDSSVTLDNMGKVYLRKKDFQLAYFVYEEACMLKISCFSKDKDVTLESLTNTALMNAKNERYDKALRILKSIARAQKARFGEESQPYVETLGMIGYMRFMLLEFESALRDLEAVSAWQKMHMDELHPSVQMTENAIESTKKCMEGKASLWV